MAVGSATDAYIHHEERLKITQGMLKLLLKHRFPVFISTKRNLIIRDIEVLKEIDKNAILPSDLQHSLKRGVILSVSVSTLDEKITNILEPGAITPLQRLQLIKQLKEQGFLVGINAIPVLPFISDTEKELEKIFASAKEHQADYILVGGLTLFGDGIADSKTLFYKFLDRYDSSLIQRYQQIYGSNFYTSFAYQNELKEKVERLCKKYWIRNSILE